MKCFHFIVTWLVVDVGIIVYYYVLSVSGFVLESSFMIGSDGANLSHFWRAKNLGSILRISKMLSDN